VPGFGPINIFGIGGRERVSPFAIGSLQNNLSPISTDDLSLKGQNIAVSPFKDEPSEFTIFNGLEAFALRLKSITAQGQRLNQAKNDNFCQRKPSLIHFVPWLLAYLNKYARTWPIPMGPAERPQ
jgi:hypothetical protein